MSGDKLDDAIDGAVREIMGTEPPAGLRQRVIRRLAEPERRARFAVPRLAFVTAVLLAVAVGAFVMLTMNRGRTTAPIEVAVAPQPSGPAGPAVAAPVVTQNTPSPIAERATRPPAGGRTGTPRPSAGRTHRIGDFAHGPGRYRGHCAARPASEDRPCTGGVRRRPDGRHRNRAVAADGTREDRAVVVNAALSGSEVRMLKQTVTTVAAASLLTVALVAQQKPAPSPARPATTPQQPTATERPPQPAPARAPEGQPVNIRLEITITDQAGPGEPAKKTITMVVADRSNGGIRSSGTQAVTSSGLAPVSINVDASPTILKEGSIRLQLGLEYQPRPTQDPAQTCGSTVSNVARSTSGSP